ANAQGLRCTRQMIAMLQDQLIQTGRLAEEREIIYEETHCILDACFELGRGDIARGAVRAFQAGVLDIPFAPSRLNAGKVLPARDNEGAVRLFDPGNLPLSPDLLRYHKAKIEERARCEKRPPTFQMVIDDVYAISKGQLVGRPR
ncbi:MAG: methylaspartate mutase subunit E, partial [Clostridiaceae bacterium]|nr:methylaspartate mutase subunit E [Clostridiaceae bacterium]